MGYPAPTVLPVLTTLTLDSRQVAPGAIFCAVPGRSQDGRAYLADACAQGAALVLLPEGPGLKTGLPSRVCAHFRGAPRH